MAANEGGTGDDDKGRRGGRKGGGGKGGMGERRRQRKERRTTDGGKGRRRAEETGATKVVGADGDDGGQRRGQRESNRENNRTWAAGWAAAGPQAGVAPPPKSGPAVSRDAEEDEEGSRGSALWRQLIPSKCLIIPARKVVHDAGREASVDECQQGYTGRCGEKENGHTQDEFVHTQNHHLSDCKYTHQPKSAARYLPTGARREILRRDCGETEMLLSVGMVRRFLKNVPDTRATRMLFKRSHG